MTQIAKLQKLEITPKSEELKLLKNSREFDIYHERLETTLIKEIGEDWEPKALQLFNQYPAYFKNTTRSRHSYLVLLDYVLMLKKELNLWEDFFSLSISSIQEILKSTSWCFNGKEMSNYLRVLKMTKTTNAVISRVDFSNFEKLIDNVQDQDIQKQVSSFSSDFLELLKTDSIFEDDGRTIDAVRLTTLILIAGIYGEERVTAIVEQKRLNKVSFDEEVLIKLLENDTFVDEPLLWRLELVSLDYDRSVYSLDSKND